MDAPSGWPTYGEGVKDGAAGFALGPEPSGTYARFFAWWRQRPGLLDIVFAAALTAIATLSVIFDWGTLDGYTGPAWLHVFLWIAPPVALLWRRHHGIIVLGFISIIAIVEVSLDGGDTPSSAMLIFAMYAVGAHTTNRRHSVTVASTFLGIALVTMLLTLTSEPGQIIGNMVLFAIGWVVGDNLRTRRAFRTSLLERAERAEQLRDAMARQAVIEERSRIARELHDVVAHSMSIMVVQASAARRVLHKKPEQADTALEAIESVGRDSLDEMRRILGVLRSEDHMDEVTPQPHLDDLETLFDDFRGAGLPVHYDVQGQPVPLPASVELTVYRIVQESLTNALKHAGQATARVRLTYDLENVHVLVSDDGRGVLGAAEVTGAQKGLLGMRERVEAFSGHFASGPVTGGGYAVNATIPLRPEPRPTQEITP